jgi:hypothetical protein
MPLEQWEIDLQNQLSGVKGAPAPKPSQPKKDEQPPNPQEKKQESNTATFFVTLIFLLVVTLFVYDDKTGGRLRSYIPNIFSSAADKPKKRPEPRREDPKVEEPKKKDDSQASNQSDLEKMRAENKQQFEAVNNRLNKASETVRLLALLLNENFAIISQGLPDTLMFLNRDWTVDRLPRHLDLSPEEKEALNKQLKK